ncbi:FIST signal transduction protein [Kordiimonas pumila]|uniref:FIST signal transduction protein n=1 Tax=Kordiimonas pumila TaxID=2161677 RepID=A0ABV7D5G4_9PROT|nr:FIST N-terminal domain-containing protein [Kordiimonas pumila]
MLTLHTFAASHKETSKALAAIAQKINVAPINGSFVFAFYGCHHHGDHIHTFIQKAWPTVPFVGGTSNTGLICSGELLDEYSIGFLVIEDPDGCYGAASCNLEGDIAVNAKATLLKALENAGCDGELPRLVWVYGAPGSEEDVITSLRSIIGDHCPIMGGSSADNTVEGYWQQLGPAGITQKGLAIGVLFPSGEVGISFQGGYQPTGISGTVTKTAAKKPHTTASRKILEIDNKPAAEVYNNWAGGIFDSALQTGGGILQTASLYPIAVKTGEIMGIPQYLLIHPDAISKAGALHTFAEITEGTVVHFMEGNPDLLIERAGNVVREAISQLPESNSGLAGGIVTYCAGCKIAVDSKMPSVANNIADNFAGLPHIGCFTFGEQGQFAGCNVHGNLMISAIIFSG